MRPFILSFLLLVSCSSSPELRYSNYSSVRVIQFDDEGKIISSEVLPGKSVSSDFVEGSLTVNGVKYFGSYSVESL